jgi:hypothetical protein
MPRLLEPMLARSAHSDAWPRRVGLRVQAGRVPRHPLRRPWPAPVAQPTTRGWMPSDVHPQRICSLVLARCDVGASVASRGGRRQNLIYTGRTGTASPSASSTSCELLLPIQIDAGPFDQGGPPPGARFVRPELVCEVAFRELTLAGKSDMPRSSDCAQTSRRLRSPGKADGLQDHRGPSEGRSGSSACSACWASTSSSLCPSTRKTCTPSGSRWPATYVLASLPTGWKIVGHEDAGVETLVLALVLGPIVAPFRIAWIIAKFREAGRLQQLARGG